MTFRARRPLAIPASGLQGEEYNARPIGRSYFPLGARRTPEQTNPPDELTDPPFNVSATDDSEESIVLSWEFEGEDAVFAIYIREVGETVWALLDETTSLQLVLTEDDGIEPGVSYQFYVTAQQAGKTVSVASNIAVGSIVAAPEFLSNLIWDENTFESGNSNEGNYDDLFTFTNTPEEPHTVTCTLAEQPEMEGYGLVNATPARTDGVVYMEFVVDLGNNPPNSLAYFLSMLPIIESGTILPVIELQMGSTFCVMYCDLGSSNHGPILPDFEGRVVVGVYADFYNNRIKVNVNGGWLVFNGISLNRNGTFITGTSFPITPNAGLYPRAYIQVREGIAEPGDFPQALSISLRGRTEEFEHAPTFDVERAWLSGGPITSPNTQVTFEDENSKIVLSSNGTGAFVSNGVLQTPDASEDQLRYVEIHLDDLQHSAGAQDRRVIAFRNFDTNAPLSGVVVFQNDSNFTFMVYRDFSEAAFTIFDTELTVFQERRLGFLWNAAENVIAFKVDNLWVEDNYSFSETPVFHTCDWGGAADVRLTAMSDIQVLSGTSSFSARVVQKNEVVLPDNSLYLGEVDIG